MLVRRVIVAATLGVAGLAIAPSPAAPRQSDTFQEFQTPSKNIHCAWSSPPSELRCDIDSGLKPKPPRPTNCTLDFGDSIEVARTGTSVLVCHGDTTRDPKAKVLPYGKTWSHGGITCKSRTEGLRCANVAGHGFFLSRQSYRRF